MPIFVASYLKKIAGRLSTTCGMFFSGTNLSEILNKGGGSNTSKPVAVIAAILLAAVVFQSAFNISFYVHTEGLITQRSSDEYKIVQRAELAEFFNDNGYYGYGVLFYRLPGLIDNLIPSIVFENKDNERNKFRNYHYNLLLISLVSLLGISFLISRVISKRPDVILLSTLALFTNFILNKAWGDFLTRVHPEIFLSFMVALALYFTFKMILIGDNKKRIWGIAFAWAAAFSAKLTAIFFLPGLVFLWMPRFTKSAVIKGSLLASGILVAFFIIGFPQNFKVQKYIDTVKYQSNFVLSPDMESVIEWWGLLVSHSWGALLIILIISILYVEKTDAARNFTKVKLFRIAIIGVLPFFLLITKKIISAHYYYTFSFAVAIMVTFAFISTLLFQRYMEKLPPVFRGNRFLKSIFVLIVIVVIAKNNEAGVISYRNGICISEGQRAAALVAKLNQSGEKVLMTSYFPFDPDLKGIINFERFTQNHLISGSVVALNKSMYIRYGKDYKNVATYTRRNVGNERKYNFIKKFYKVFKGKNVPIDSFGNHTIDAHGNRWAKLFDSCNWEIWKKQAIGN